MENKIEIREDYIQAFEDAISKGLEAEEYMYMCSDEEYDYFKHKMTRECKKFRREKIFL